MNPKTPTPLPLENWAEYPRLKLKRKLQGPMELREEDLERYWSKVAKKSENECWIWNGTKSHGYGTISIMSGVIKAHCIAVYLSGRFIPDNMCACHSCDTPLCVNPNHLWIGTNAENVADRQQKNRCKTKASRGEAQWNSKLKTEQVISILWDKRTHQAIALEYGISRFKRHPNKNK